MIDVAIVGAGPAGAWAAYVLARAARACRSSTRRIRARSRAAAASPAARSRWSPTPSTPADCPASVDPLGPVHGLRERRSAVVPLDDRGSSADSALVVASRATFDARAARRRALAPAPTLDRSRVTDVDGRRRRRHARDDRRRPPRRVRDRRRRRQQPGPAPLARAVPPRSAVDCHRLLRARRHQRRDRHRADVRSARLHLVVSAAHASGDRHLRAGRCGRDGRGAARADRARGFAATRIADGARLEPYSWPIPSLGASGLRRGRAGRAALVRWSATRPAWSIRSRAKGSTSRCVGPMGRRRARRPATAPQRLRARVRDEIVSELARAARLKAGFFRPAFTGLLIRALQQSARHSRGDGRSRRRPPGLRGAEMAAAPHARVAPGAQRSGRSWA